MLRIKAKLVLPVIALTYWLLAIQKGGRFDKDRVCVRELAMFFEHSDESLWQSVIRNCNWLKNTQ